MKVSDILAQKSSKLVGIASETSVRRAVAIMAAEHVGALVVEDLDGRLLGVVSEHGVIDGLARRGGHLLDMSVSEILVADGPTVSPDDSVTAAMRLMTERRARHLPVIADARLVGLISVGDVLKSRLAEKTEEVSVLQDIARFRLAV
ncbi:MAG: CBS domain-containing protein [Pseudomonadota bacterium]|jgi:CBS domain-containing protein